MTQPRTRRMRALAAGVAATTCLWITGAAGAAQATSDPHADIAAQYSSLSTSLIGFYAAKSDKTVSDYLATQQILLQPAEMTLPGSEPLPGPEGTPSVDPSLLGDPETPGGSSVPVPTADPSTAPTPGVTTGGPSLDTSSFETLDVAALSATGGLLLTADQLGTITGQAVPVTATDLAGLTAQLESSGLTVPTSGYTDLSALAKKVSKSARTPDGAVTLASASWASELGKLRTPKLKGAGKKASLPGVPAEALPFGLLMNKSLTNMVTDHPNLISKAQNQHGLGSPALVKAWNSSMAKAYSQSATELTSLLPNPCVGEMMGVMATGKSSGSRNGCAPACTVAGQYLHQQAGAAFEPGRNSMTPNVSNPAGGILNHATFTNMATWAQGMVGAQNPTLISPGAISSPGNGPSQCASASSAAKNTLGTKLPGLFATLR